MYIPARQGVASASSVSLPSLSRSGGAATADQFLQTGGTANDGVHAPPTSSNNEKRVRRVHHQQLSSSRDGDELSREGACLGDSVVTSVSCRGGGDIISSLSVGVAAVGTNSSSGGDNNNNNSASLSRSPRVSLLLLFTLLLVVCLLLFGGDGSAAMTTLSGGSLRMSRFLFENGLFSGGGADSDSNIEDGALSKEGMEAESLPEDADDVRWLLGSEGVLASAAEGATQSGTPQQRDRLKKAARRKHIPPETHEERILRLRKRYWAADTEEEEVGDEDAGSTPNAPKLHRYSITACAHVYTLPNVPADLIDTHPFYKARVQCYCLEPPWIYAAAGQYVAAECNKSSESTATIPASPPNNNNNNNNPHLPPEANGTSLNNNTTRLSWLPPIPPPNRRTCLLRVRSALIYKKKKQSSKRKPKKDHGGGANGGLVGGGSAAFTQPNEIMIGSPDPSIGFFFRIDVEDPKIDRHVFLRSTWNGGVVKSEASPHGIAAGDPIANLPISVNLRVNHAPTLFIPSAIFQMSFYHSVVGPHGVVQLESTRGAINRFYAEGRGPDTDGTSGGDNAEGEENGEAANATATPPCPAGQDGTNASSPAVQSSNSAPNLYPPLRHVFEPLPTISSSKTSGTDSSSSASPFPFLFPPSSDPDAYNGANRPDPRPILDTVEIGKLDYRWHMARCSMFDYHKLALPVVLPPSSEHSVGGVYHRDKGGDGGVSKTASNSGGSSPSNSSPSSLSSSPPLPYLAPEVIVGDSTYLHFKPIVPTLEWFGRGRVNSNLVGGGLSWISGCKTNSSSNNVMNSSVSSSPFHSRLGFCQQQLTKEGGALIATEDLWVGTLSGQIGANWATSKGYRQLGAVSRAEGLRGAADQQKPLSVVSGTGSTSGNRANNAQQASAVVLLPFSPPLPFLRPASLAPPTPFVRPTPLFPPLNDTVTLEEYATICPMSRWELKAHRYGLAQMKRVLDEELRRATSYSVSTTTNPESDSSPPPARASASSAPSTAVQHFAGYDSSNPPPCHVKPIAVHRSGGSTSSSSTRTVCPLVVARGVSRDVQRTRGIPKGLEFSIVDALLMPLPTTASGAGAAHETAAAQQLEVLNTKASGGLPACALGEQTERPFLYQGLTFAEETSLMVIPASPAVVVGASSYSSSTSSSSASTVPLYHPSQLVRRRFDELSMVEQYGLVQSADLFIVEEGAPGVWAYLMGGEGGKGERLSSDQKQEKQRSAARRRRLQLRRRQVTVVLVFGHNYDRSLRMNDEVVRGDRIVAVPRSDPIEVLIATEFFMTSPFITRNVRVLLFTYQQGRMPSFAKLREAYDRPWRPETVLVGCEGNATRIASFKDLEPLC